MVKLMVHQYSTPQMLKHYQGTIDWNQVARGNRISYAYMKATEGATYVDDTYAYNIREARRVGLSVGSYHFYRPNVSPQEQFDNIVSNIKANEQDLAPIIDIEHRGNVSEDRFIADLKTLIRMVEQHYGCKPLLYSYQNFYNRYLCGHFNGYHFMIAKYQADDRASESMQRRIHDLSPARTAAPSPCAGRAGRNHPRHAHEAPILSRDLCRPPFVPLQG